MVNKNQNQRQPTWQMVKRMQKKIKQNQLKVDNISDLIERLDFENHLLKEQLSRQSKEKIDLKHAILAILDNYAREMLDVDYKIAVEALQKL